MERTSENITTNTTDKSSVPVLEERLVVDTQQTVIGQVNVNKSVHTETVDIPLSTVTTRINETRVPINKVVEKHPEVRIEGDVTIIPVVREEAVVIKRLVLVEEIHLTKDTTTTEHTEKVQLRSESVTINRE